MRRSPLFALVAATLLTGCSAAGDRPERALVAPGKYVLYDCAQLARVEAKFVERDKELTRLMARAKEGPGGGLISTMVYDPDYYSNRGELADVRREQAAKNCQPASRIGAAAR